MRISIAIALILFLAACQTTSTGIGARPSASSNSGASIDVLDVDFSQAIELAKKAASRAYDDVILGGGDSKVLISNTNFLAGDVRAVIDPILVRDEDSGNTGIIFEVKAEGVGTNMSFVPGYVSDGFLLR